MSSKLKKKKRRRERPDTMDYQEALKDPAWENEVRWADNIMASNRRLGLKSFKLDKLTKGEGSCFPIAVLQQLNREEVFGYLRDDLRQLTRTMDYHLFRQRVKDFVCMFEWNHLKVKELKKFFYIDQGAKQAAGEETKTWEEYWGTMLIDTEWADAYFIQATAWYLEMNIQIMDTKCNKDEPYYTIDGNFGGEGCSDILYIGYFSEVHYQSLMIDYSVEHTETDISMENEDMDNEKALEEDSHENSVNFDDSKKNKKIKLEDDVLEPSRMKELDNRCPCCHKTFKNLLLHIKKSKKCKISKEEQRELDEKSKGIRKEKWKER